MISLFGTKFNGGFFFGLAILIRLLFPDLSWYSYIAIMISVQQIILLFNSLDHVIPIRYLFGSFMCLQMFIGPALAYNGLDKFQYAYYVMKIPEAVYFAYVIPAVICFIVGLHISAGKLKGEVLDVNGIKRFADSNRDLPYWFIGIGFVSSMVSGYFSSEFAFVLFLLGSFKFIGLFLLILGSKKLKLVELVLVYGSIVISSFVGAMFHDLLTWLIMLGAVLAIKYKPGLNVKLGVCFSFLLLTVTIQLLKGTLREDKNRQEDGLESFQKAFEKVDANTGFFNLRNLATNNVRINQGFIVTNIMKTVPEKVPHANGEQLMQLVEAAVMPRILAPDKLRAGDRTMFMKYSGMPIRRGTSMGLSSIGDAYVNFGVVGGCIFMFVLGLLYNEVLKAFHRYSKFYPVLLLFVPLVFYYPIRPDCELQTILGHLVKSCFLIFVIFQVWKNSFRLQPSAA